MLKKIFHSIVIAVVIVHIAICSEFFGGTNLWSYLTYLCALFFVVVGLQYIQKGGRLNALERLSIFYFIFLFLLTILYGNASTNLVPLIGRSMEIATLLMIVKMHKNDLTFVLTTGTIVFSVCVYCNLLVLVQNPLGLIGDDGEAYYLLGTNYNQIGPKVIIAFLFSVLLSSRRKAVIINTIAVAVTGMISLVVVNSMTSAVSMALLLVVYLISWNRRFNRLILWGSLAAVILFQILVVFVGNALSPDGSNAFLDLIGKDASFTGRTELWTYSAGYFWDSPFWGHGYIDPSDYLDSGYFYGISKNSHNYIYNILHKGGLILLFVILNMIRISYRRIKVRMDERSAYIIIMTGVTFLIMCLFEVYDAIYTYLLLIFMYYYNEFIPGPGKINNR